MKKTLFHWLAINLLGFLFAVDAMSKLLDNQKETWMLTHKTKQIETSLYNNYDYLHETVILNFLEGIARYASLIQFSVGAIEVSAAFSYLLLEDSRVRNRFITVLLLVLCYDTLLIHLPFTELARNYEKEMSHCVCNTLLAGSLLMVAGFRDLSE